MTYELITIKREKISDNRIYGFVLKESKKLLMIRQVYDLRPDGLLIINKKDISFCESTRANQYQSQMLKALGIYENIDFKADYDLTNWQAFFESVHQDFGYFEIDDDRFGVNIFYLGKLLKIKKKSISLHEFTGAGNWYKKPTKIPYKHISTVGIGMHYTQMYAQYFELTSKQGK